jgi:hypothetical protein
MYSTKQMLSIKVATWMRACRELPSHAWHAWFLWQYTTPPTLHAAWMEHPGMSGIEVHRSLISAVMLVAG